MSACNHYRVIERKLNGFHWLENGSSTTCTKNDIIRIYEGLKFQRENGGVPVCQFVSGIVTQIVTQMVSMAGMWRVVRQQRH
jgi:hypothetical protein